MNRRDLLRATGAATVLSLLPSHAGDAWARVLSGQRAAAGLTPAQRALVSAVADTIIPRTDTPGATDVGITDWVDLIVAEYYTEDDRSSFVAGLDAIEAEMRAARGRAFAELDTDVRREMVSGLDAPADRRSVEARAYAQLKRLVVHGYFTSEPVQREVLRTQVFHDHFQGAADLPVKRP